MPKTFDISPNLVTLFNLESQTPVITSSKMGLLCMKANSLTYKYIFLPRYLP